MQHSSLTIRQGDRVRLAGRSGTFVVSRCWGRMLDAVDGSGHHELTSTWAIVMILSGVQKGVRKAARF